MRSFLELWARPRQEAALTECCKPSCSLLSLPLYSFLLLLLLFAVSLPLRLHYPPGVLRLAAVGPYTRFHHVNLTSPLKDWPHTKLLFKGKKIHTLGVGRGFAGRVCAHARGSPLRARTERKWSTPPCCCWLISLCHEARRLCASHFLCVL